MPSNKLLISHSWNLSSSLHSDFWQVSSSVPVTKHTDIFLFVCFNLISFFVIFLRSELYVLCINLTLLSRVPNSSDRMVLISVPLPGVGHEIKRYKVLFGSFWGALSNKTFGLLDSSIFSCFFSFILTKYWIQCALGYQLEPYECVYQFSLCTSPSITASGCSKRRDFWGISIRQSELYSQPTPGWFSRIILVWDFKLWTSWRNDPYALLFLDRPLVVSSYF